MRRFIDVVIFKNVINLDKLFTYSVDFNVKVGQFVIIDFNGSLEIALVLKSYESNEVFDVKKALKVIEELTPLDETKLALGMWMKEFYILTYAKAFGTICDFNKISNLSYKYEIKGLIPNEIEEIVYKLNSKKTIDKGDESFLEKFVEDELIYKTPFYNVMRGDFIEFYGFSMDLNNSLKLIRKNSNRQIDLTTILFEKYSSNRFFSSEDLANNEEYDKNVFEELLRKGIFYKINDYEIDIPISNLVLTKKQLEITKAIKSSNKNKFLIRGVTGSGKTEMYFNLIEDVLSKGKNAIFLVPEIGLTPQMEIRTRKRFGDLVAIIHSKLTRKKRLTEINKIESNQARILLGTRSAIFSNISNLGLIIVDEEHDDSYKLDNYNKYDVREVSRFIIERTPDAKLVLGSATPSIETFYKAKNGIYELHVIEERPNKVKMPRIMVTDMREELKSGNKTAFSLDLMASMKESLNKDKQILLFLNRRGYSTFVTCRSCGYTSKCHRCDVSLVYHKKNNLLKCHYCGHMEKTPSACPNCGSRDIRQFGMGTEKLEEETKSLFPDFQIMRIDSDTTSRAETYRENVEKILKKEVSIIIGTQMISKGFDFPEIDLVGIIASDLSLNVPEYDAAEKTFQLIMQVSGRSGRNDEQGNVIIQTYNPEHYSIRHAKNNDYNGFYEDELKIRKIFSYPPFKRQYIITILNRDLNDGINISKKLFDALLEEISNKKIGKYVDIISHRDRMSISRLNNRYHINILLNSTIRHEKFIKNIIYEVFIKNKFKINLNNTHIDVVTR